MDGDFIKESIEARERTHFGSGAKSALRAIYTSITLIHRPVVVLPAITYLAMQLALMYLYLEGASGFLGGLWSMLLGGAGSGGLGHYPGHLLLMQPVLGRATMILDALLNIIFQATTVCLVAAVFRDRKASLSSGLATSLRNYPQLLVISVTASVSVFLLMNLSRYLSSEMAGLGRIAVAGSGVVASLVVQLLLVFAIPMVVLERPRIGAVLPGAFRLAWKYLASAVFLVLLPFILTVPTTFLSLKAGLIAMRLSPDFMIHNHIASLVMESVSGWILLAGATVFLIHRRHGGKRGAGEPDPESARQ